MCVYEQHEEDSGDEDDDKEVKVDVKLGPVIKYSEVCISTFWFCILPSCWVHQCGRVVFQIAGLPAEKMVYKFFRAVLKQWEEDLLKRTERSGLPSSSYLLIWCLNMYLCVCMYVWT